jgi:hypothetical protein
MLPPCSIICFLPNWFSLFWPEIYGCLWGGHNGSHLQETISLTHSDRLSQVYFGKQKAQFISHKRVRWWLVGRTCCMGPVRLSVFSAVQVKENIIHRQQTKNQNHSDFQVSCFWFWRRFTKVVVLWGMSWKHGNSVWLSSDIEPNYSWVLYRVYFKKTRKRRGTSKKVLIALRNLSADLFKRDSNFCAGILLAN